MFIALVGFGIGGATSGGIFDALGIGGGSSGSDPQYSQQIDNANEALQQDPKDEKALLKLARYNFLEGQAALQTDDQGRVTLSQDSLDSYRAATDAWERYLKTDPKKPNDDVAGLMIKVYSTSAGTDPASLESDVNGAYESAKVVAQARPSLGAYTDLATWAYLSGNTEAGDQAKAEGAQGGAGLDDQEADRDAAEAGPATAPTGRQGAEEERSGSEPTPGSALRPQRRHLGRASRRDALVGRATAGAHPPRRSRYHHRSRAISSVGRAGDS